MSEASPDWQNSRTARVPDVLGSHITGPPIWPDP
jgi:hypothetical protein